MVSITHSPLPRVFACNDPTQVLTHGRPQTISLHEAPSSLGFMLAPRDSNAREHLTVKFLCGGEGCRAERGNHCELIEGESEGRECYRATLLIE
jgi:hypothetical protein